MVTPGFFATMGIPLLAGRAFDAKPTARARPAVGVISQALARQSFGELDPVGRRLLVNYAGEFRPVEIVGVAGDVKHASLEAPAEPHLYVPYYQTHPKLLVWLALNQFLVVRASGEALALGPAVRRELRAVDPGVASLGGRLSGDFVATAAARAALHARAAGAVRGGGAAPGGRRHLRGRRVRGRPAHARDRAAPRSRRLRRGHPRPRARRGPAAQRRRHRRRAGGRARRGARARRACCSGSARPTPRPTRPWSSCCWP